MAISLAVHAAAVLVDWYDPVQPIAVRGQLQVSLVTAKTVSPEAVFAEKPLEPPSLTAHVPPPPVPDPAGAHRAQEVRAPEPEPIRPVPQQPKLQQPKLQQPKPQPVPKVQATGPESVFQCVDLLCSALSNPSAVQPSAASRPPRKPAARATAKAAESSPDMPPVSTEPAAAELVNSRPRYQSNPLPEYPYLARQRHWEGRVWLLVTVSATGRVLDLEVAESSGYGILDKSALKTVRRWQFLPAKRLGAAVPSQVKIPVEFRLQE